MATIIRLKPVVKKITIRVKILLLIFTNYKLHNQMKIVIWRLQKFILAVYFCLQKIKRKWRT